jgi:hypothetical protein
MVPDYNPATQEAEVGESKDPSLRPDKCKTLPEKQTKRKRIMVWLKC